MKKLFHTVLTTQRHREFGYCEESDFGSIELIELQKEDKELIVSFEKYTDERVEFIEYEGRAFRRIEKNYPHHSQEQENEQQKMQGRYSEKTAKKLMLFIRERAEDRFSSAPNYSFILIGRVLYESYSDVKSLGITVTGNLSFSYWLSMNIEAHFNLDVLPLSKSNFQKLFKEQKARFEKGKPKAGQRIGDGHVSFSYPKKITWGKNYSK